MPDVPNIIRIPQKDAQVYFDFTCAALFGYMAQADEMMKQERPRIRRAAQALFHNFTQQRPLRLKKVYRGVLLKQPNFLVLSPDSRQFLSFTEDPKIACHFADASSEGFGAGQEPMLCPKTGRIIPMHEFTRQNLGEHGYIIEHEPELAKDVLFHWHLIGVLPYVKAFGEQGSLTLIKQKEVIIDPMSRSFPVQKRGDFLSALLTPTPNPQEGR